MERTRIKIKDLSKLEEHGFVWHEDALKIGGDKSCWRYGRIAVRQSGFAIVYGVTSDTLRKFAELVKADLIEFTRDGDGKVRVEMTKEEYERWKEITPLP